MNPSDFKLRIPKPCHEDWHGMSPEEKGRHCQQCSMTVRDFTQMSREEAQRTAQREKTHCGRFRSDQLHGLGGGGEVAYRYPITRMRAFVVAFLLTFGLGSFALDAESLSEFQPFEQELKRIPLDLLASENPIPDSTQLFGLVLDATSGEPLELVTVQAEWQGVVIYSAVTDSTGLFELRIPKENRNGLAIRASLGETMLLQENVPIDVKEVTILLNSGVELPPIVIVGNQVGWGDGDWQGIVEAPIKHVGVIAKHTRECGHILSNTSTGRYYHRLHDFIQMRSSEVFTKDW